MTQEQLASLAQSLKDNEAFQAVLADTRSNALEMLATTPPSETETLHKYQATVRVIDDIRGNLEQFIRSGAPKKPAGIA